MKVLANNAEQEEAEDIIDITYFGKSMEIGFNVNYLLDILNVMKGNNVRIFITDSISGTQIEDRSNSTAKYVVMPRDLEPT